MLNLWSLVINKWGLDLIIYILFIITIFFSISILIQKNAVVSIIYFMLVYVSTSLYLYYNGYYGMPLLLILIYVGAIAILFLFILTLINVKEQESDYTSYNNNNILILINLLLLLLISYNSIIKYTGSNFNILDSLASQSGNGLDINIINGLNIITNLYNLYLNTSIIDYPISTSSEVIIIGQTMYTTYALLLLILAVILVLSIIAAIAILYNSYKRPSDEDTGIQSH